jgi:autotransporter-associated beta strand protein
MLVLSGKIFYMTPMKPNPSTVAISRSSRTSTFLISNIGLANAYGRSLILAFACIFALQIGRSQPTTNVWLGMSTNWNDSANWSEGATPVPSDVIVFQGNFGTSTTNNCTINANELLSGIVFNGGGWYAGQPQGSTGYKLYTDVNGITVTSMGITDLVYQCYLNADQAWLVASNSTLQTKSIGNASYTVYFGDSGTNTGTLLLTGSTATSNARLQVNGGTVILNRSGSVPSVSYLTITNGSVIVKAANQFDPTRTFTLNGPNALLNNGNRIDRFATLTLWAGTIAGGGYFGGSNAVNSSTIQGNISLGAANDPLLTLGCISTSTTNGFDVYGNIRTLTVNSDVILPDQLWDSQSAPNGGLIKDGPGRLVLQSAWAYAGETEVGAGLLAVDSVSGTNSMVVDSGGTLGGTGVMVAPLAINAGGFLAPGDPVVTNAFGTLTISNAAVLGGTTLIKISGDGGLTNSALAGGALTLGGSLVVTNLGTNALAVGNAFKIFNFGALTGSFTATNLPAGYTWDASALGTSGVITVTAVNSLPNSPTNIICSLAGGNITVSWPTGYTGWLLQAQTNGLNVGLGTNWTVVPNSSITNVMSFPVNNNNPAVFYRLAHP